METILIGAAAQYLIPLLGTVITGLVGWGVVVLKKKTDLDVAKTALDQVDQIVGTVVGNLSQTTAKDLKKLSQDGHLSKADRLNLRSTAFSQAKQLVSTQVSRAAEKSVDNLGQYIRDKIEERVLAGKIRGA